MISLPTNIVDIVFGRNRTVRFGNTVFERSYTSSNGRELLSYYGPNGDVAFDLLDFEDAVKVAAAISIGEVAHAI